MHKHGYKLVRTSFITVEGKNTEVHVWQCQTCDKLYIQDTKTGYRVHLNGQMGEEA